MLYEKQGWFRIELPDDWVAEDGEEPVTFHHPDGAGGLQMSALTLDGRKPDERIDVFLALRGFLRGEGVKFHEAKARREARDGHEVASYEHEADEPGEGRVFWRTWFITNQDVLAFATYGCAAADKDLERDVVDRIIASIRLTSVR